MSEQASSFVIGAVFDAERALIKLNEFITAVKTKAAEASVAITTSLAGGGKAGEFVDADLVRNNLNRVEELTKRSLSKVGKDYEKSSKTSGTAMSSATKEMEKYGTQIGTVAGRFEGMLQALAAYAGAHKIVMQGLQTQVTAYADALDAVSTKFNVPIKDLVDAMKGMGKAGKQTEKDMEKAGEAAQGAADAGQNSASQQELVNKAIKEGVGFLNSRISSMHEEAQLIDSVIEGQKVRASQIKGELKSLKKTSELTELEKEGVEGIAGGQEKLNTLTARRENLLKMLSNTNKNIESSYERQGKLSADVHKSTTGIAKQALFAAANFATVIKRVLLWSTAIGFIFGTIQKINQAFTESIDLQNKMVQIAKIKPFDFDVVPLSKAALDTAVRYGISVGEIAETMRVFAQQGKDVNEILALIDTAAQGVVATNLTMNNSVQLLTAAMNIFGKTTDEVGIVLDKIQAVQSRFAITAEDLADAMKLLGPIIKVLGSDMDFLLGSVTAVAEATRQSGKFVGNALKTIFARLPKKDSVFLINSLGVELYNLEGNLRPLQKIIGDLAAQWDTLTGAAKLNIAVTLGGIRRYNVFMTLMDNYQTVVEASATSMSSFGEVQNAVQKESESFSRRLSKVKEQFRALGIEATQNLLPILVGVAESFTLLAKKEVIFTIATIAAAAAMTRLIKSVAGLASFSNLLAATQINIKVFGSAAAVASGRLVAMAGKSVIAASSMIFLGRSIQGAKVALIAFGRAAAVSAPVLILVGAALTAVVLTIKKISSTMRENKLLTDQMTEAYRKFTTVGLDFSKLGNIEGVALAGSMGLASLVANLKAAGVETQSTGALLNKLQATLLFYVKGFSTKETVKELQKAQKAAINTQQGFEKFFTSLYRSDSDIGLSLGKGLGRSFKKVGIGAEELKGILQTSISKAMNEVDTDEPTKTFLAALSKSIFIRGNEFGISIPYLSNVTKELGSSIDETGKVTRVVSEAMDKYYQKIGENIALQGDANKSIIAGIRVQFKQKDALNEIIKSAIKHADINKATDKTYIGRVKLLQKYISNLERLSGEEERHILNNEELQISLLAMNEEYQQLGDTLDDIKNKHKTQVDLAKSVGLGYDEAKGALGTYTKTAETYITTLNSLTLTEKKHARALAFAKRQEILLRGKGDIYGTDFQTELRDSEGALKGMSESFDAADQANARLYASADDLQFKLNQLRQAYPQITADTLAFLSSVDDLADSLEKAGQVTFNYTNQFVDINKELNEYDIKLRSAVAGMGLTAKGFNSMEQRGKVLQSVLGNLSGFFTGVAAAEASATKETALLEDKIGEIEASLKTFESQRISPLAFTAEEIAEVDNYITSISKAGDELSRIEADGILRDALKQRAKEKLIKLEKEFNTWIKTSVDNAGELFAIDAKMLLQREIQLDKELTIRSKLNQLYVSDIKQIELTNKLYDSRRDSILSTGLAEADSLRIKNDIYGVENQNAELAALEISDAKQKLLLDNERSRLADLRRLKEQAIVEVYKLQRKELDLVIKNQESYFSKVGDLLTSPIERAISLSNDLGFKISRTIKLFDVQKRTNEELLKTQIAYLESKKTEDDINNSGLDRDIRELQLKHDIAAIQEQINKNVSIENLKVEDLIKSLEKANETYSEIRATILATASDFDKLIEDAHVFTDLFDEIGRIFYRKGVENIFDTMFEAPNNKLAEALESGKLDIKLTSIIDPSVLAELERKIGEAIQIDRAAAIKFQDSVASAIHSTEETLVQTMETIGQSYVSILSDMISSVDTQALIEAMVVIRQLRGELERIKSDFNQRTGTEQAASDTKTTRLLSELTGYAGGVKNYANAMRYQNKNIENLTDELAGDRSLSDIISSGPIDVSIVGATPAAAAILLGGLPDEPTGGDDPGEPDLGRDLGKSVLRLQSGISLLSVAMGSIAGVNTGRGIASGAGIGGSIASLLELGTSGTNALLGIGAIAGMFYGIQRDKDARRKEEEAERHRAEERRKEAIEAARTRAAILDATERVVNNTNPISSSVLFAPTGFRIPSYALQGGAIPGGQTNQFNITVPLGADARRVGEEIANKVNGNYQEESFRQSSNSDSYL